MKSPSTCKHLPDRFEVKNFVMWSKLPPLNYCIYHFSFLFFYVWLISAQGNRTFYSQLLLYCGHSQDHDLVSVLARVHKSGVREKNRKFICWIYGRRKYLDRLDELIQGDETAKLAYEEKNATRKINSTEVDYDCFAIVEKIPLTVRYNESWNNKIVLSGRTKWP